MRTKLKGQLGIFLIATGFILHTYTTVSFAQFSEASEAAVRKNVFGAGDNVTGSIMHAEIQHSDLMDNAGVNLIRIVHYIKTNYSDCNPAVSNIPCGGNGAGFVPTDPQTGPSRNPAHTNQIGYYIQDGLVYEYHSIFSSGPNQWFKVDQVPVDNLIGVTLGAALFIPPRSICCFHNGCTKFAPNNAGIQSPVTLWRGLWWKGSVRTENLTGDASTILKKMHPSDSDFVEFVDHAVHGFYTHDSRSGNNLAIDFYENYLISYNCGNLACPAPTGPATKCLKAVGGQCYCSTTGLPQSSSWNGVNLQPIGYDDTIQTGDTEHVKLTLTSSTNWSVCMNYAPGSECVCESDPLSIAWMRPDIDYKCTLCPIEVGIPQTCYDVWWSIESDPDALVTLAYVSGQTYRLLLDDTKSRLSSDPALSSIVVKVQEIDNPSNSTSVTITVWRPPSDVYGRRCGGMPDECRLIDFAGVEYALAGCVTDSECQFLRTAEGAACGLLNFDIIDQASELSRLYFPPECNDPGVANAFVHAWINCVVARRCSTSLAKTWWDKHEETSMFPCQGVVMDLHNNAVGRTKAYASARSCTDEVLDAIEAGELRWSTIPEWEQYYRDGAPEGMNPDLDGACVTWESQLFPGHRCAGMLP